MNKKIFIIILILTPFLIMIYMLWSIRSVEAAKQVISLYDQKTHRVIYKKETQNYDDVISNKKLKELALLRDKCNILWYKKTGVGVDSLAFKSGWRKSYRILNTCVIYSKFSTFLPLSQKPINIASGAEYDRITILKKYKGKWYIHSDIIGSDNEASISQAFKQEYINNQINEYREWYKEIEAATRNSEHE